VRAPFVRRSQGRSRRVERVGGAKADGEKTRGLKECSERGRVQGQASKQRRQRRVLYRARRVQVQKKRERARTRKTHTTQQSGCAWTQRTQPAATISLGDAAVARSCQGPRSKAQARPIWWLLASPNSQSAPAALGSPTFHMLPQCGACRELCSSISSQPRRASRLISSQKTCVCSAVDPENFASISPSPRPAVYSWADIQAQSTGCAAACSDHDDAHMHATRLALHLFAGRCVAKSVAHSTSLISSFTVSERQYTV
jgi:hypothetical protein